MSTGDQADSPRSARQHGPEERAFIEDHQGLVKSIVLKVCQEIDARVHLDELIACGYEGLLQARARFDATRGAQFKTFAYYRIRGAVLDGVRRLGPMSRQGVVWSRMIESGDSIAENALEERLALGANATTETSLASLQSAMRRMVTTHLVAEAAESEPTQAPDVRFARQETQEHIQAVVSGLPDHERRVVEAFYFEELTMEEIAKELGVSKSWVSRVHHKSLDLLRVRLKHLAP